jgi:hypothetical protein
MQITLVKNFVGHKVKFVNRNRIDFLAIARRCLQPLADRGFTLGDNQLGREEVRLDCDRDEINIRVCYEPFGPPFCDLRQNGNSQRRIDVESEFQSSTRLAMASLPYSETLLKKHVEEVEAWCKKLLVKLEDEKIVT